MEIKDLSATPFEEIIACFLKAFEGYFVKLPDDIEYWRARFIVARVDWKLSFGMFEEDKLVGYVLHGIDDHHEKRTAYNTGTGVLPDYRGKAIVDQIYAHALPLLRKQGIQKCLLEVICENKRAIKVYERIGFGITRTLKTFSGQLPEADSELTLQKCNFSEVLQKSLYQPGHYAWDNSAEAVKISEEKVQTYLLGERSDPEAYLVMDREGNIIQLESKSGNYLKLLTAAGALAKEVKLKNVDAKREILIETLQKFHFSNPVNQYKMEMFI